MFTQILDRFGDDNDSTILVQRTDTSFAPPTCPDAVSIGVNCSTSSALCDVLLPCQNNGICNHTNITLVGYTCSCATGFNGARCEDDHRPCKPDTCWNQGMNRLISVVDVDGMTFLFLQASAMTHRTAHPPVYVQQVGKGRIVRDK